MMVQTLEFIEPEIRALLEQCPQRRKCHPRLAVCPRCDQVGRAGHFRATKNKNIITYFIVHHKIGGTWGKIRLQRYKRCYMRKGREEDIFVSKMEQERLENESRR
jgi:hypothetical protein